MATFETSETLPKYFRDIKEMVPLSLEQEHALGRRIAAGDDDAVMELVQHNLKIVVTLANRHIGQGVPIGDLIQEGNMGLIEAARRYTPDKESKFITYATLWIRKYLNEAVVEHGRIVRIPHNQEYEIYKAKKAGEETRNLTTINLDQPVGEDGDVTMADMLCRSLPDVDTLSDIAHTKFTVSKVLSTLKDRDRKIVSLYFGIDSEYAVPTDILAERFDMTNVRICQIVKGAINKMKESV
jgi:RNA polymerase primary sigma factor